MNANETPRMPRCPICDATAQVIGQKSLFSKITCDVLRCDECLHEFAILLAAVNNASRMIDALAKETYSTVDYFELDKLHQGMNSILIDESYDPWIKARYNKLSESILSTYPSATKLRIAEVGCLEGAFVHYLQSQGHSVIGFDVNRAVVEGSRRINNINLNYLDAEFEHLPKDSYDIVLSYHTLEHVRHLDFVLENMRQSLCANGHLLIEVPSSPSEAYNPDHFHNFSEQSLGKLVGKYFDAVTITEDSYETITKIECRSLICVARKAGPTAP